MGRQIKPGRSLGKQAKRIVRFEIDECLSDLSQTFKTTAEVDETIHTVRKRLKKLRAVLRLLRTELGDCLYRRENAAYRDAARQLRDVRDAESLIESLDKLRQHAGEDLPQAVCDDLRNLLQQRKQALSESFLASNSVSVKVVSMLTLARERVGDWDLKELDWRQLRGRVKSTFVAGSRAFHITTTELTPDHLHEWRKQVKYLSNELQVLGPIWRGARRKLGRDLDELANLLGDDHDLARLAETVKLRAAASATGSELNALMTLIDDRRQTLEQSAHALGQQVYSRSPRAVVRQLRHWWKR